MGISIMMTTMMLTNDVDQNDGDDDDSVNFEPEQDDGISYNFLHRSPLPCPQLATDLTYP